MLDFLTKFKFYKICFIYFIISIIVICIRNLKFIFLLDKSYYYICLIMFLINNFFIIRL